MRAQGRRDGRVELPRADSELRHDQRGAHDRGGTGEWGDGGGVEHSMLHHHLHGPPPAPVPLPAPKTDDTTLFALSSPPNVGLDTLWGR